MMDAAIDRILEARHARRVLAPLGDLAPADTQAGYALQRALAERVGAVPPAGFKIGATAARMQAYLGLDGPVAGFMEAGRLHAGGATVRYAEFSAPGVECEIAVRLGRNLPSGDCTLEEATAAVAEVFPAIEIVENRYGDLRLLGTPTLIADQVFHAGAVLGVPCATWRSLDLAALPGAIRVAGEVRGEGHGRDLLGHPLEALRWLAGSGAAAAFGGLLAGQVVLLGSVTPPIWLDAPGRVEVSFGALGMVDLALA